MKALVLALSIALLASALWFLNRDESGQSLRDLEPEGKPASVIDARERMDVSESATPPETSDAVQPPESAARASASKLPSWTLEVSLSGVDINLEKEIELVAYAADEPEITTTQVASGNGVHRFDVSKVARDAPSRLTVLIDHPQFYIQEETYVGARAGDEVTFRAEIALDPFLTTFRGTVRVPQGSDVNLVQLGVFSKRGFQLDAQPTGVTRPKPDGSFSFDVEDPAKCVLLAAQRELRPASRWFEAQPGETYEGIELVLDAGHRIRGTAYASGSPAQGGYVRYERPESNFHQVRLAGLTLAQFGDRFEFTRVRKQIGKSGEFELNGLANTLYELTLQPAEELGARSLVLSGYRIEQEVRAPAEGIVLESSYQLREILVIANGAPVNEAMVRIGQNESQLFLSGKTKEDGRMKIGLIEQQPCFVQVFVDGYHPQLLKLELNQIARGVSTVFDLQRK